MLSKEAIYEYERVLLEKKRKLPMYIFPMGDYAKEDFAIDLMKYGIKTYLGWSKEQTVTNLTYDILDRIKCTELIDYLISPPEISPKEDFFFVVNKLYPGARDFDFRDLVVGVYKKVLSGQISRFPKGFFEGENGELRASLCLQYAISQTKMFRSLEDAYDFFSSPEAVTYLKKMKIAGPLVTTYSNALEYFHDALSDEVKSDLYYNFYIFNKMLSDIQNKRAAN